MENAEYYFDLGVEEYQKGELLNCIEYLEKALEIQEDYIHAWNGLGSVYFERQDYEKAIEHLEKALEIQEDYIHAWNGLGSVYFERQDYEKAIEHNQKALEIQEDYVHAWNGLGSVYFERQDYEKAIEHHEKALEIQEDYVHAWNGLGSVYFERQDYEKAIEHYQKALEIQEDYVHAWYGLGNIYYHLKDYDKAIEHYQKALEIQEDYVYAWSGLGDVYKDLKACDKSILHYRKALEIQEDYVYAWGGLGNIYDDLKAYDNAIEYYQKALEIQPNRVNTWHDLGIVYIHLKEYNKAIECFQKALRIQVDYIYARDGLGTAYKELKEYDKAIEYYQQILEIQPDYVNALHGLGYAFQQLNQHEKSIQYYRKALEIQSNFVHSWNGLGNVYNKLKKYEKAIEHFEKAIEIQEDFVNSWNGLGFTYLNLEKYQKTIQCLEKVLDLDYDFTDAWSLLGYAYWKKTSPNYTFAHTYFNRFIHIASVEELGERIGDIISFFIDYSSSPYLLKRLLGQSADRNILINSLSAFGNINRQCAGIDKYMSFLSYLPFKALDEQIRTLKNQLKDSNISLKKANTIAAENDIRKQIHTQQETLSSSEIQFDNLFREETEKTLTNWQLEALVNHFMGDCITAHRIYDEEIETNFPDQMTMMDRYYYILSANQFLHPEAKYLLTDTLENEVNKYLEKGVNTDKPLEIYYAAQIYLLAWQSQEERLYLEKAHKLFLKIDFYLPAQYMSVYTAEHLGEKEQQQKQIEKIAKSKEKWFSEGWKIRPFDIENPDFLRQFKRYAHFSEVQEAINLIHDAQERQYKFPPFYEAFEFKISEQEEYNFKQFIRRREGLFVANELCTKLDIQITTYQNDAYILKDRSGELTIFSDIERSESSDSLESKLVEFIFAWKLNAKPAEKANIYTDVVMYAVIMQKLSLEIALRLIVYIQVVQTYHATNSENSVVSKFESTLYNYLLRGGASAVVFQISGDVTYSVGTLAVNFVGSFSNTMVEYRKKIFGVGVSQISAVESYKKFKELYFEDLGERLQEFKAKGWIEEEFVKNLQREYDKQMVIFE
jgi:tetratricopeptide (TPR) repeat protein